MDSATRRFRYSALAVTVLGGLLFARLYQHSSHNSAAVQASAPTFTSNAANTAPPPTNSPGGTYKDGTYTGSVADAFYGNIQVKATISGGRIQSITFLQHPSDNGRSRSINEAAMPLLTQEAISAQNANVDIVSGATDSSQAFIQSLQDALSQA